MTANVNAPMLAVGIGMCVLSLLGMAGLLVGRGRRRRVRPADGPGAGGVTPLAALDPAATDHPDVRALRAQIRVLEQTLERVAASAIEPPELTAYRRQVRIAVTAVARRTPPGADVHAALQRVSAAIARLDATPADRVVLPLPQAPVVAPVVEAPVAVETDGTVVEEAARPDEPVGPVEPADAVEPSLPEDDPVLPVPPPASVATRRGRLRLRRSAA